MAEASLIYILKWMVYYLFFGMAVHVVDRYFGVPFYRWWYSRSREVPIPGDVEMGFLYNRPFKRRRNWALVISAVQSGYTVYQGEALHWGAEFVVLVFEAAVFLVGFRLGDMAYRFIRRQEGLTERIDQVGESIERASVVATFRTWVSAPLSALRNMARSSPPSARAPEAAPSPHAEAPPPEPDDPRKRLARFIEGRSS